VIATDHAGHPVTDLQPEDLRVLDDGAQQRITSLRLNPSDPAQVLVILFDLLDLSFQQAGYEAEQLRKTFAGLTTSDTLYLYVLVANGNPYPVHALPGANASPPTAEDAHWIEQAGPLLDQALKKVSQARSIEFIAQPEERFRATFSALESLEQSMARIGGRKQLLWITDGIPSSVRLTGEGPVNLASSLRKLGAQFSGANIAIYTLDPSLALGTLSRDGLEILSQATGGRTFISSDLKKALQQARMDTSASYLLE
jgi:VWFA-related protein